MDITTRKEAMSRGLKWYFTGKMCKNGHFSRRRVLNGECYECRLEHKRKYRKKYSSDLSKYLRGYRQKNKERTRELVREYKKKYKDYFNSYDARRRAKKLDQTCSCCTNKDIYGVYKDAHLIGCEVDHIIPLSLGGLHCRHNLQVLTPEQHREKTRKDISEISKVRK